MDSEEAHHISVVAGLLATLGHAYGDFNAQDEPWSMTERTAADPVAHVALVPRTLEARAWMRRHQCRPSCAWLAAEHQAPILRPPFNHAARRAAGFSAGELAAPGSCPISRA